MTTQVATQERRVGARSGDTIIGVRAKQAAPVESKHEQPRAGLDGLSPELRVQMQSIVRAAVEQALVPILQKQAELEQILDRHDKTEQRFEHAVSELRRDFEQALARPPLPASVTRSTDSSKHITAADQRPPSSKMTAATALAGSGGAGASAATAPLATSAFDLTPSTKDEPAPSAFPLQGSPTAAMPNATLTTGAANAIGAATTTAAHWGSPMGGAQRTPAVFVRESVDVPWQLSGARRRRTIAWVVGTLATLALAAVCTAMILSQLGYKI